jgi:hypothetical protein
MAAAAAVLGLGGDEEDEEDVESVENSGDPADPDDPAGWEADSDLDEDDDDDPPLDEEVIEELKAEFRSSLVRVFGYSELSTNPLISSRTGGVTRQSNWCVTFSSEALTTLSSTVRRRPFIIRCRRN